MCVKLHSVCEKLHTVCEITQCAQNYTYSIGKNSPQLKNFTLTPLAALATNMSCEYRQHLIHLVHLMHMMHFIYLNTPINQLFQLNQSHRTRNLPDLHYLFAMLVEERTHMFSKLIHTLFKQTNLKQRNLWMIE